MQFTVIHHYPQKITKITVPTNSGHTFAKYTGDGTCGGNSGEQYIASDGTIASDLYCDIYKNATLTAQWTANTYYVKYNANGGSGSMGNSTHTYGTAKALTCKYIFLCGTRFYWMEFNSRRRPRLYESAICY